MATLAITTDPADARSRRKRYVKKPRQGLQQLRADHLQPALRRHRGRRQDRQDAARGQRRRLRHPASLTKIMTLYLLFEQLEAGKIKLDTPMQVSAEAASQAPTKLGLRPGQTLAVEDAIKALVTKSANDAAVVVAEALAGSEDEFARQMTRKARALGMNRTDLPQRLRPAGRRAGHHGARPGAARPRDPGALPALLPLFLDCELQSIAATPCATTTGCSAASKASTASRPATPAPPASIS